MSRKRILSLLLCVTMVVSLFVGFVPTASAEGVDSGLYTDKSYDPIRGVLTLESYAKGEMVTVVTEKHIASDIVLVLDVSGSMDDHLTIGDISDDSFLDTLDKTREVGYYQTLVNDTAWRNMKYEDGHWKVYNKTWGTWKNWEDKLFDCSDVAVTKINSLKDSVNTFVDIVAADAAQNNVEHKISIVKFAADDYYNDSESYLGEGDHTSGGDNYTEVVKGFTSDANAIKNAVNALDTGGATAADYGMTKAKYLLNNARSESNKVVVLFTDGAPTHGSADDDFSDDSEAIGVASDTISISKQLKDKDVSVYSVGVFGKETNSIKTYMSGVSSNYPNATSYTSLGAQKASNYYFTASTVGMLNTVFQTIAEEVITGGSFIKLGSTAVVRDIISDYFELTYGNDTSKISVYTAPCTGENTFGPKTAYPAAQISISGKTVDVSNFDFSANWCGKTETGAYRGSKLIVEIPITPRSDVDVGKYATNESGSGVYDGDTPVDNFPVPEMTVGGKLYVIDYAQPLTVNASDWGQKNIGVYGSLTKGSVSTSYGTVSAAANSITYTPTTMKWNGSDSVYSLGQNISDSEYSWAKVSFVPANNVYYEDTFVKTNGISYSGTWTTDGSDAGNAGTANTKEFAGGWQNTSLKTDTAYSNGSAHKVVASNSNQASASFSFTGTGVDVYSRTNDTTGTIFATIKGGSVNEAVSIDNKLVGKDFYQVPTLSFSNLPYGTYDVTIYATTAAGAKRATYYLDGIRVYNPANYTQDSAYPAAERNAKFAEVRDNIISANAFSLDSSVSGAVFVDTKTSGASVADYKAYGPENEVYLAKDQAIVFKLASVSDNYYVGLSAPEGSTGAKVTNGSGASELSIGSASDLFYKITPDSNGYIMIKNTGDKILAVSKVSTTGSATRLFSSMSYAPTLAYANSFNAMQSTPCADEPESIPSFPFDSIFQNHLNIIRSFVDDLFYSIKDLFSRF